MDITNLYRPIQIFKPHGYHTPIPAIQRPKISHTQTCHSTTKCITDPDLSFNDRRYHRPRPAIQRPNVSHTQTCHSIPEGWGWEGGDPRVSLLSRVRLVDAGLCAGGCLLFMAARSGDAASWGERLTRISAEITNVKEVVVVVVEIYCTVIASFVN